jgi:hypothetical protein
MKLSLFFYLLTMLGCQSNRIFIPGNYQGKYIAVGNGGGFTGKTTIYYLLDDGKIYKGSDFSNEFVHLGSLGKSFSMQQWEIYNQQNLADRELNDPGNFYYFLEFRNVKNTKKYVWHNIEQDHEIIETIYLNINRKIQLFLE